MNFSQNNKVRKRNKRHPNWKRISKTIFEDDIIHIFLHTEKPKNPPHTCITRANKQIQQRCKVQE